MVVNFTSAICHKLDIYLCHSVLYFANYDKTIFLNVSQAMKNNSQSILKMVFFLSLNAFAFKKNI
jgi:hypothetical protein